jgi:hypothetical protein
MSALLQLSAIHLLRKHADWRALCADWRALCAD